MKYKNVFLIVTGLSLFLVLSGFAFMQENPPSKLELSIETAKQSYQLGEPIDLSFTLINRSSENIEAGCFGIGTGDVQVYISDGKNAFLEYDAGWGNVDAVCKNLLKPNDRVETSAKILWNHKIEESDIIAPDVIKRAREGKIVSDYAFSKAGTYFIKAVTLGKVPAKIESEPIKITIEEPAGDDLEVWNRIKDNGHIAYFLQNGYFDIPSYRPEETEKLRQEAEQIIIDHPNSSYAESFKQNLEKLKAIEEKRKAFLEKIKNQ